jgi:hypothetical protein
MKYVLDYTISYPLVSVECSPVPVWRLAVAFVVGKRTQENAALPLRRVKAVTDTAHIHRGATVEAVWFRRGDAVIVTAASPASRPAPKVADMQCGTINRPGRYQPHLRLWSARDRNPLSPDPAQIGLSRTEWEVHPHLSVAAGS